MRKPWVHKTYKGPWRAERMNMQYSQGETNQLTKAKWWEPLCAEKEDIHIPKEQDASNV